MNSNDLAGRLAIVAPSVATLMNQPMKNFNGGFLPSGFWNPETGNQLRFYVKIKNTEEQFTVECASAGKCFY